MGFKSTSGGALKVWFDGTQAQKFLLQTVPKITNQETNRAMRKVGSEFGKAFTASRLVKGVFWPHRKVKMKKNPTGQPPLPVRMRKAGFKAVLGGKVKIAGKYLSIYTKNPLLVMREKGEPLRAQNRHHMVIRADPKDAFSGKGAKRRRARWQKKADSMESIGHRNVRPIVAQLKYVKPFPRLGFERTWNTFAGRRKMIMGQIDERVARRANLAARRLKAA